MFNGKAEKMAQVIMNAMKPNRVEDIISLRKRAWSKDKLRNLDLEQKGYAVKSRMNQTLTRSESLNKIRRLQRSYLANPYLRRFKRIFDIIISSLVLMFVLSWIYPLLFVLIKLESKGPVIFKQKRNGLDLKPFWCYKFRSMHLNDEADILPVQSRDSRITKVGSFIRKYNIDELPQFMNVLKGEMSVVGPRPHMLSETNNFNQLSIDFYKRHEVKPGITGLAQIQNCRGKISSIYDLSNRVKYDLFYIRKASFGFDLSIVLMTFLKMIQGDEKAL